MIFPLRASRALYVLIIYSLLTILNVPTAHTADNPFPLLPGLEGAVEFWKQIFSRYGSSEVVFFDPLDAGTIYSVLQVPDTDEGRAMIDKERARIIADYDLNLEGRVKSQRGAKEQFISGLRISGRYMSQMQRIFREEGLPQELAYLPFVESSFNVRARSSVGAVGMWQFMLDTGKKFLRISDAVDERRDPLVSTRAAARLLKENYHLLGNWPLAITAYNHGTEGLFRAIGSVESDNLVEIIRHYESPSFGFASKNFYAEFLAAVDIATHSDSYFPFLRVHEPSVFREVEIHRPVALAALLKPAAISQTDFFDWNPALSPTAKVLPLGYRVKLPPEKVNSFLEADRRLMRGATVSKRPPTTRVIAAPAMRQHIVAMNQKAAIKKVEFHRTAIAVANRAKLHRAANSRNRRAAQQIKLAER
jgi:membrane-bound lytic murein transglycosylase D